MSRSEKWEISVLYLISKGTPRECLWVGFHALLFLNLFTFQGKGIFHSPELCQCSVDSEAPAGSSLASPFPPVIKNPQGKFPPQFHLGTPLTCQEFTGSPCDNQKDRRQQRRAARWENIPLAWDKEGENWAKSANFIRKTQQWREFLENEMCRSTGCYLREVVAGPVLGYFQGEGGKELPFIRAGDNWGIWGAVIGGMAADLLHLEFYFFKK